MWALESGVTRLSLRGDKFLDFWVGNLLDHGFFLSVAGLQRRDVFVSTIQHTLGWTKAIEEFWDELKWLRTGYVDLVYLSMPRDSADPAKTANDFKLFLDAYEALTQIAELECPKDECEPDMNGQPFKRIRAIGVADAHYAGMQRLLEYGHRPVAIQNKFDIYRQAEMLLHSESRIIELCDTHKILLEAYAPLGGHPFVLRPEEDPHVHHIAASLGKTPEQVLLRWVLQQGFAATMSNRVEEEIVSNSRIFDFQIPDLWMHRVSSLQWLAHSPVNQPIIDDVYDLYDADAEDSADSSPGDPPQD